MSSVCGSEIEPSRFAGGLMIILDARLPPTLAVWITETFAIPCFSAQFLNLRQAEDEEIFAFYKAKSAIVITKDDDFVSLLNRFGSPPKVIWLTCGNTSKGRLKEILKANLGSALALPETNDLVEITGL